MADVISLRARRGRKQRTIVLTQRAADALDQLLAKYRAQGDEYAEEQVVEIVLQVAAEYSYTPSPRPEGA